MRRIVQITATAAPGGYQSLYMLTDEGQVYEADWSSEEGWSLPYLIFDQNSKVVK